MTPPPHLDITATIAAPADRVFKSFFDANALGAWWQVTRSVTTPRVLGPYAVEWPTTEFRDEVLGRLGGVFRGTIMQFHEGLGFFVADAFWLPPDGEPIGPMAIEVTRTPVAAAEGAAVAEADQTVHVRIQQTGFEESPRWRRYYELVRGGWERALHSLKMLLEK